MKFILWLHPQLGMCSSLPVPELLLQRGQEQPRSLLEHLQKMQEQCGIQRV